MHCSVLYVSFFFLNLWGVLQIKTDSGRTRKRKNLLECLLATTRIVSEFIFIFDEESLIVGGDSQNNWKILWVLVKWESVVSNALSGMSWKWLCNFSPLSTHVKGNKKDLEES